MTLKYITKFNYVSACGYQVRAPLIKSGQMQPCTDGYENKFFSKGKGTWKACRELAIKWRNDYLRKNKSIKLLGTSGKTDQAAVNSVRNKSGMIGVSLSIDIKGDNVYWYYKASVSVNKKQRHKNYSVSKYGECEAFKLACAYRHKHCGTLVILDRRAIPCLPEQDFEIKL